MAQATHWSEVLKNILEAIALLTVAGWTLFRFGIYRDSFAKIEFNLDCRYIGETETDHILELSAIIENKGMIRQRIKDCSFRLLFSEEGDQLIEGDSRINFQPRFAQKTERRTWFPHKWEWTFIDAGTKQVYSYLTTVPKGTKFLLLVSKFKYPSSTDFHSSQKAFNLNILASQN